MAGIVVYEEDPQMRNLLAEWLAADGYAVHPARPGQRVAAAADLVICSVTMPRRAGAGLLREIRRAHAGVPLIAMSAQFRTGLAPLGPAARALGVERVIAKPATRGELLDAVHAMIGIPG